MEDQVSRFQPEAGRPSRGGQARAGHLSHLKVLTTLQIADVNAGEGDWALGTGGIIGWMGTI